MPTKTPSKPKPTARGRTPPARAVARPKQLAHPALGAAIKHHDVEEAADQYVEVRDSRMALTKQGTAATAALLAAMKGRGLTVYRVETEDGHLLVTVEDESKVHVRKEREKKARKARGDDTGVSAG